MPSYYSVLTNRREAAIDFTMMLVGRCFQGVGAAGIFALTEVIVTDMVPLNLRGKWFSFISAMWAIGSVAGPIVGGAFAQKCRVLPR